MAIMVEETTPLSLYRCVNCGYVEYDKPYLSKTCPACTDTGTAIWVNTDNRTNEVVYKNEKGFNFD